MTRKSSVDSEGSTGKAHSPSWLVGVGEVESGVEVNRESDKQSAGQAMTHRVPGWRVTYPRLQLRPSVFVHKEPCEVVHLDSKGLFLFYLATQF
jgi:hypothetical protein